MSVYDVAHYILQECEDMTAMKLQKLVYYSQAWSLVWDERPLFDEEIQAWVGGPVCPALYQSHKGRFKLKVSNIEGDSSLLDSDAIDTINAVIKHYGDKNGQYLSDLTHSEAPWIDARSSLPDNERGSEVITHAAMAEYYGSL